MPGVKRTLKNLFARVIPDRYFTVRLRGADAGVVFTFDDGPHPEWTQPSLDTLDYLGIKATYFLVGEWVQRRPELAREIVARGHTVGDHTFSHRAVVGLSAKQLDVEVVDSAKRLSDLTGEAVQLFRPPWGKIDPRGAMYLMRKGLRIVMWSVDSTDYKKAGASDILSRVDAIGVGAGDIILLHDDNKHTIEALPLLAESVERRGLKFGNLTNS